MYRLPSGHRMKIVSRRFAEQHVQFAEPADDAVWNTAKQEKNTADDLVNQIMDYSGMVDIKEEISSPDEEWEMNEHGQYDEMISIKEEFLQPDEQRTVNGDMPNNTQNERSLSSNLDNDCMLTDSSNEGSTTISIDSIQSITDKTMNNYYSSSNVTTYVQKIPYLSSGDVMNGCVLVYDRASNSYLIGRDAPTPANIHQWLGINPTYEIVFAGTPLAEAFLKIWIPKKPNTNHSNANWTIHQTPPTEENKTIRIDSSVQSQASFEEYQLIGPNDNQFAWSGSIDNTQLMAYTIGSNSEELIDIQRELPTDLNMFAYVQSVDILYCLPLEQLYIISVVEFIPKSHADIGDYDVLLDSLSSTKRIGVVQSDSAVVSDIFVVPSSLVNVFPSSVLKIIGKDLLSKNTLLGIIVADRTSCTEQIMQDMQDDISHNETEDEDAPIPYYSAETELLRQLESQFIGFQVE